AGDGIGELRLIMPALARLSSEGRWIVWVTPPYIPYAPALQQEGMDLSRVLVVRADTGADALWTGEQALRSGACGAVLLWPGRVGLGGRELRRLQLAAEEGGCWGVLFRDPEAARQYSPAVLRLGLDPLNRGMQVRFIKCRGRAPAVPLVIASAVEHCKGVCSQ
ncbi:MAG: translesion DNA synthesis-associated protein ImuA, partial [Gammaproteobacteria bacterium]|nr:translesion DNA synthesis-associated protein ImuA [Gammaproteobacteria bacterium]